MTKEEIYEKYWKKLVEIRRVYTGFRLDGDTIYSMYKLQAEKERDTLLEKYGYKSSPEKKIISTRPGSRLSGLDGMPGSCRSANSLMFRAALLKIILCFYIGGDE
jgi:hypothetical protein